MTSAVCPPRSPFTVTGRSPQFWSRPLGPPVRCLHPSTYAIFNTSSMASCLWVRLWLRVLGSGNPHLFLTCSWGGGGPTRSWSLLLRGFFTVSGLVVGPAQPLPIQCGRYSLSVFLLLLANRFNCLSAFCLFSLWFYCVPALRVPLGGCALRTLDVTSDWVSLARLLALPGPCGLVDW